MPAKISLLMATFNRERYVADAIRSILAQTYRDFDLLVWDDGSTDNTLAAARTAAAGDPRVRFVESEHRGIAAATNAAAGTMDGAYWGTIDSDDLLAPAALAATADVLDRAPDVGMVYTSYLVISPEGKVLGPGSRCRIPYSRDRLLIDFMTFHFRLMRKPLFHEVGGFDESKAAALDYDLCLKLSEITEIRHIDEPLYYYRVHRESISQGSRLEQIYEARDAIEAAMRRRGLDKSLELNLSIVSRFRLVKKGGAVAPDDTES